MTSSGGTEGLCTYAWGEIYDTCTMYILTNSLDVAHVVLCLLHVILLCLRRTVR